MRTVERVIVAAIVTTVPMIASTIEWSTLPLTVVPPLSRHHPPPGTDGFIPRHTVPNRTSAPTAGFSSTSEWCTSGNLAGMSSARPPRARVKSTSRVSAPGIMWLNEGHHFAAIISPATTFRRRWRSRASRAPPQVRERRPDCLRVGPPKSIIRACGEPLAPQDPRGSSGLPLTSTLHPT